MAAAPLTVVTGFPGFIGRRLVRAILQSDADARVVALVEGRMAASAETAAAEIDDQRIEIVAGDIADRGLGMPADTYERLLAETRTVHHLAAIYDLSVPLEIAQRVNVDGTGNVLEFCARCEGLERLNYVSTAYVAGDRKGVVYEHELVFGQDFKNHYESTKFQAEVWAREAMENVPTTIYRPAIVVGDSRTGETQKFDGPYYMLRVISSAERTGTPIPQFGRSGATINVVPVDFVVDALIAGAGDPAAIGQTLHLVDPEPVTASDVLGLLSGEYAGKEPGLRLPPQLVSASLRIGAVRKLYGGAPPEGIVYLNHPVRFDTRQAADLLSRHGLSCPRFKDYVGPIVRFFRENEDDPAYAPKAVA